MREWDLSMEYHAGLSMLTMKVQVSANGLPMALPVVFQAPVRGGHDLFQALDPVTNIASLALTAPLVLQHEGRPAFVSANMQMPAGELCIPMKSRMSLQNASKPTRTMTELQKATQPLFYPHIQLNINQKMSH